MTKKTVWSILVDLFGLPLRRRASHRRALRDFSRALTGSTTDQSLVVMLASQIESLFHPLGLAIVLAQEPRTYGTVLARGRLAGQTLWRSGSRFKPLHPVAAELASRQCVVEVARVLQRVRPAQQEIWRQVAGSGVALLVPLHLHGRLVGWIALGSRASRLSYTRSDRELLSSLANQSAVALGISLLHGEMQQRANELTTLALASSALSSSLELEQVLQTIVESVIKVVHCDKSAIFELSADGQTLSLRVSRGLSAAYCEASRQIPVDATGRARVIVTRELTVVVDILREPGQAALRPLASREGYRAVVDLPLIARDELLGLLSVYFCDAHSPSAVELEVLSTFANQAAIAIANARLYDTVSRERDRARDLYVQANAALAARVDELTAIEEISRRLTASLDLQQVMNVVLEQSVQAARADRGVIWLYNAERRGLHPVAEAGFALIARYQNGFWPDTRGITGRVARSGLPALVPDISQDADYVRGSESTRSQLSVPILHEKQPIGVITLESDRLGAFAAEHLHFAELLADHAAIGIHNAQLFQQAMEGRDRLQAILNSTRDAVIVLDTGGNVILANRAVEDWFGSALTRWLSSVSVLDAAAQPDSYLYRVTDLDAARLLAFLNSADDSGEEGIEIAFHFRKGTRQLYIEATVAPVLNPLGETIGWVTVLRDMTRQQDLERFREDLTSMVIHNLQGPLAAVISSLETLREMKEIGDEMAEQLLSIALDSGRKLHSRIGTVLWLRRLEDRQIPLSRHPARLRGVVENVLDEYRAMANLSSVSMDSVLPPDLPCVFMDEEVISRVLSNLLDNALKYTPAQGRIEVRAVLETANNTEAVVCSVADSGPGIAEQMREAIFGKFYQGDEWLGRRRGMGIGLHYCKLAVEAHGGRIWVDCEEGQGSIFSFTLPVDNDH
ncbi:MAG TPA: GAF domain-containing protein [Anaerolineae bacterium]|nr:GAF domain-containing protein [Anaerolineae bacterium]